MLTLLLGLACQGALKEDFDDAPGDVDSSTTGTVACHGDTGGPVDTGSAGCIAPEPEDCEDGVDNDADGRIDCEDGECAGASACQEDCADGVDNDVDGLTDCFDDDCLGISGCDMVVSQVLGGVGVSSSRRGDHYSWTGYYRADGTLTGSDTFFPSLSLTDERYALLSGVARVVTDEASWSCTWQASVWWSHERTSQFHNWVDHGSETGHSWLGTSGACGGLSEESVLPASLRWAGDLAGQDPFGNAVDPWAEAASYQLVSSSVRSSHNERYRTTSSGGGYTVYGNRSFRSFHRSSFVIEPGAELVVPYQKSSH